MAYSAPELLILGAAQNLVLCSSALFVGKRDCDLQYEREDIGNFYDEGGLW